MLSNTYFYGAITKTYGKKVGVDGMTESPLIDLRRLRYVIEAARAGSVTAAARTLSISQPALTRSIAELERELGFQIFQRLPRGIVLTETGESFVNRARVIIDDLAALSHEVRTGNDEHVGRLRIGFSPAGYIHSVREVIGEFAHKYPGIAIETVTGLPQSVCNKLFRGELDILVGLTSYFEQWPGLETVRLLALQSACMVRKGHPLAGKNDVCEADLTGYPLVLPESAEPGLSKLAASHKAGTSHYVTDDFSLVTSLLNNTDAMYPLVTSQAVMDLMAEDFHLIREAIDLSENHIAVGFVKHREKTTAAKIFTDMVTAYLGDDHAAKLVRLY